MRPGVCVLAIAVAGLAATANAHDLTLSECVEGSEFIMHAAMARDNGMSRNDFIGRMQGDILAIQSMPKELRWFVQDLDDEALLVGHAERVYDAPGTPQAHQSEFMRVCLAQRERQTRAARSRFDGEGE